MSRKVTFYFALTSTWAYVGYAAFAEMVKRTGVEVDYRPLPLHDLFAATGGLPLPKRAPSRQAYRIQELQRWREKRGLKFNLYPRHWPLHNSLADRIVLAALARGEDVHPLLLNYFTAIWEREENLEDEATLVRLANESGYDGQALLAGANVLDIEIRYQQNLQDAVAAGVFGSPALVLDGEIFWGQDRIELLESAIVSGRAPYGIPPRP